MQPSSESKEFPDSACRSVQHTVFLSLLWSVQLKLRLRGCLRVSFHAGFLLRAASALWMSCAGIYDLHTAHGLKYSLVPDVGELKMYEIAAAG